MHPAAATYLVPLPFLSFRCQKSVITHQRSAGSSIFTPVPVKQCSKYNRLKMPSASVSASPQDNTSIVDYNTSTSVYISVFPAEACETIGGEACDVEMYPEAKLTPDLKSSQPQIVSEEMVDREYLDYNTPKTVFPGEACDDLGGEFCEPEYQAGVY
ncbi:light-regulated protein-like [Heracleum sosnowskyi]|uniref:Light-regulated protein-like n=1 Tax=Heracleum sosnowskyi TaxID=360622 RepID=A0AAD8M9F8_9APIA|nr:light-regulated protein-like [Heracleum sosnowskyi]